MNCEMFNNLDNIMKSVPMGSGELMPDKPIKMGVRWSKTSGLYDGGAVDESGTSNPSGVRGCQLRRLFLCFLFHSFDSIEKLSLPQVFISLIFATASHFVLFFVTSPKIL